MITDHDMIRKTKSFGLNTYEVKIWTALLSRAVSTAGELSDIANVPRSRSYDVLESLEKKGFVVMKLGKPIKYLAVPPKEVMERVKTQIENKTKNYLLKITSQTFQNLINELQEKHESTIHRTENTVALIKGKGNIQKHLEFLFKNAKSSIVLVLENTTKKYIELLKSNTKNRSKNLEVTIVTASNIDELKEGTNQKKQDVGARMCIVDENSTVIFPISEKEIHPDYDIGVWIKNNQTSKFLKSLLDYS